LAAFAEWHATSSARHQPSWLEEGRTHPCGEQPYVLAIAEQIGFRSPPNTSFSPWSPCA
jgi:hypothetical protein